MTAALGRPDPGGRGPRGGPLGRDAARPPRMGRGEALNWGGKLFMDVCLDITE